jgi:flagellar basal-body rod protein FlgB
MLENLTVFDLASAMARHATVRHRVIAENVANADTPGYRARDTQPFSAVVNDAFTARTTRPEHLVSAGLSRAAEPRIGEIDYPASPDGNSVSLADQSRRATEATGQHRLAFAVYSKAADILRLGLGPNR